MAARDDCIAAIATPPAAGGVGIVRVSGTGLKAFARVLSGRDPEPRQAMLSDFRDGRGETLDRGILLFFPAPSSVYRGGRD